MRGLVFRHPPSPLLAMIPSEAVVGLYHATQDEAPTKAYAGHFLEHGHRIALPRMGEQMEFAEWTDPFGESDLENGSFGTKQPGSDAQLLVPDVLIVPLIGFTERGQRLGQGGGHYDRWLALHQGTPAIGLAWDCQKVDALPMEPHDQRLTAVATPTRFYGPFDA